jgi:hypothetical protein
MFALVSITSNDIFIFAELARNHIRARTYSHTYFTPPCRSFIELLAFLFSEFQQSALNDPVHNLGAICNPQL